MGVGPGAHGRIERGGDRLASAAIRSPKRWMGQVGELGHGFESMDKLSKNEMADEILLMGLRLTQGIDLASLRRLCGLAINAQKIDELVSVGLCEMSSADEFLRASDRGICVLNQIVAQLSDALEPV